MVRLPPMIVVDLEREEAPVRVFRWVSYGASHTDQRRRTDLALHLRRSIERPRNGWVFERPLGAALAEWDRVRSEARKRGGIMPAHNQIPLEAYRAAIEGARKPKRARSPETETAAEGEPSEQALEDDSESEGDGEDEGEDEGEEEPVSTRHLKGLRHVLQVLANTARKAIAAEDMEAADAANNAIEWLCGGREAS